MTTNCAESYAGPGEYGRQEMMTVAASALVRDQDLALVGYGLPMVAGLLAKATHAGNAVLMTEAGIYDADPEHLPYCVGEARFSRNTTWFGTTTELLAMALPTKRVDLGFLGGAQVDKYGNINSTCIGEYLGKKKRFEGSGGAADFAALANRTLIILNHEKRRLVNLVDYITSPGWKCRKYPEGKLVMREELGLSGGPEAVVSTMGVMKFDPVTREMYVHSYYHDLGVTLEEIKANTEFDIDVSRAVPCTPPTYAQLEILRTRIDPDGHFVSRYDS